MSKKLTELESATLADVTGYLAKFPTATTSRALAETGRKQGIYYSARKKSGLSSEPKRKYRREKVAQDKPVKAASPRKKALVVIMGDPSEIAAMLREHL